MFQVLGLEGMQWTMTHQFAVMRTALFEIKTACLDSNCFLYTDDVNTLEHKDVSQVNMLYVTRQYFVTTGL